MSHSAFILEFIRAIRAQSYLELGVNEGKTFIPIAGLVQRAIGVDVQDLRKSRIGEYYRQSTDEFFQTFKERVDVVFIDADHAFEQVRKDFYNAERCLNDSGTIFLHDTDPISQKYLEPTSSHDAYRLVSLLRELERDRFDVLTIPMGEAGLSIVRRAGDRRVLHFAHPY